MNAASDREWKITVDFSKGFTGDLVVHIHPIDGVPIQSSTIGTVARQSVLLKMDSLAGKSHIELSVT
jgi:hypothetical protein